LSDIAREPILEMYKFEVAQMLEQLEQLTINGEKYNKYSDEEINEIFRIMHTIKGSSAMMVFNGMTKIAHSIEDLFFYIREKKPENLDYSRITDLVLEGADFMKSELSKIEDGIEPDGDPSKLVENNRGYLDQLKSIDDSDDLETKKDEGSKKQKYYISYNLSEAKNIENKNCFKACIYFEDGCEMENVRAFSVIHSLKEYVSQIESDPQDILENENSLEIIKREGFKLVFCTDRSYDDIYNILNKTIFLKQLDLEKIDESETEQHIKKIPQIELDDKPIIPESAKIEREKEASSKALQQNIISVNVTKLDKLMDLVGELVISEAMVTGSSDLKNLELENFNKAARQLKKITAELQDMVMSIRMVPLAATFHKMNRIVRDMCKKLNKDVQLEILGENTEVDKNIIENISDPLMHLIRNSIDHGIESSKEREMKGKNEKGKIILEAKNEGGEVVIQVKDDGKGMNREKILKKAMEHGIIDDPSKEMSDNEIYSMIFLPGFSTNETITEFSGRGVGMDVVIKNIQKVGGLVDVSSSPDMGTTITLRIPLTLAIVDGMNIRVGNSIYTLPTTSIKESYRVSDDDLIKDTDGNEMIMVRGQCYPVLRINKLFSINNSCQNMEDGIIIMVEDGVNTVCLFADELLGEQQVVVKALPNYIKKVNGITGCTLLGEGSISLILDVSGIIKTYKK